MSNVINMGGGGIDLVTGTLKSGSHVIYSDGDVSYDETPTVDKSVPVLGNSIVYAPFGLTGGATAMSQAGFWLVTDDFTALEASATASTTPKSGVTYTNGISDLTPDILSKFAAAISNNPNITYDTATVYCDLTSYHRKITVGDTVPISMDDRVHDFRVLAFNTEKLTSASAYGSTTYTGMAGIVFGMDDVYDHAYQMKPDTEDQYVAYADLYMNTTVLPLMKQKLPTIWSDKIKAVSHYNVVTANLYTDIPDSPVNVSEEVFLPAWYNILSFPHIGDNPPYGLYISYEKYGYPAPTSEKWIGNTWNPAYKYWESLYEGLSTKTDFITLANKKNGQSTVPYWVRGWFQTKNESERTFNNCGYMYKDTLYTDRIFWIGNNVRSTTNYVSFCFCL